jgi:Tfp pilus assembly protein PilF
MVLVLGLVVAALAALLYVNTLGHRYVLDDVGLISGNTLTRQGLAAVPLIFTSDYWAGASSGTFASLPLYRPLSKAIFAAEWELAPNGPALGHGVNVLLYALTGFLLFVMLAQYSRPRLLLPFATAVLFAAHPIHTEAVANIKSLDEILCVLCFALTAMATHRFAKRGSPWFLALAGAAFFLALLSKESAVTFLAVIPLMLFVFTDARRSRIAASVGVLSLVTGVFLLVRRTVLAHTAAAPVPMIENYLVSLTDATTRTASAIYLLGVYLLRLVVPHPLISDGSYRHFPVVAVSDWRFLLACGACAVLLVYALRGLRKKDPASFGIFYFFVTVSIVSNVFVLIGTNYGERLLYAPSLGICLAGGALLVRRFRADETAVPSTLGGFVQAYRWPLLALALVTAAFAVKTVIRNADWYDNRTLFATDVRLAPKSARLHVGLAQELVKDAERRGVADATRSADLTRAVAELNRSLEIDPEFGRALAGLARAYQAMGDNDRAPAFYERALRVEPTAELHSNYGAFLFLRGDYPRAIEHYRTAVQHSPGFAAARTNLGLAYARFGDRLAGAAEVQSNAQLAQELRRAARENLQSAVAELERAVAADPSDGYAYQVLGAVYEAMGDESKAQYYLTRAAQLPRRVNP